MEHFSPELVVVVAVCSGFGKRWAEEEKGARDRRSGERGGPPEL